MADTLNNFGLAEIKTLKTANKMVLTDIDIKMPVNEIENINPEYIRAGASIFGTEGTYGVAQESVVIPAGIYELTYNYDTSSTELNIPFYYLGNKCDRIWSGGEFDLTRVYMHLENAEAGQELSCDLYYDGSRPGSHLGYLIYIPEDCDVTSSQIKAFYSIASPYVSCKITATDTIQLKDPSTAAELLIDRETGNYAETTYDFKFRTPYMERNGGYHTSAGIEVTNNYNGTVDAIRYRNEAGNNYADYWLPYYTNNTVDFGYASGAQSGQYIKPDVDQNIDPQVLAWVIVNLQQLNPTGGVCKNCGASASKATLVCEACDKKYWIGSDVLSTASVAYEKVMDIDDELKLYVAKCNDSTIYTSDNRHITSLSTSIPTSASVAINTKYNTTDNTGETQLTLYTSSMDDVSQVYCASGCDCVGNDSTGRDGEINIYTYTADAPFFLKSNRTFYIKGGSWNTQIQSFTYQANNLNLYEIYGDNAVLTCYGGEYWYSDFSMIDDNTGYAGYAECPYSYCAAKFYSTYDDSITNEARTCPACSNTIYFSSQYSDDLQCSASAPATKYWYREDTFEAAEEITDYRSCCSCPYENCNTEFYIDYSSTVNTNERTCPECLNTICFFDDNSMDPICVKASECYYAFSGDSWKCTHEDIGGDNSSYYKTECPAGCGALLSISNYGHWEEPIYTDCPSCGAALSVTASDGYGTFIYVNGDNPGVTWNTLQLNTTYNLDYTGGDSDYKYYIFTAPTSGDYTFASTSNGDPDIYAYYTESGALSGDDLAWSNSESGGFSYTCNMADGDTIYIKVRQYSDASDTWSVSQTSSADPMYQCPNCDTWYHSEEDMNSCSVREGCPGYGEQLYYCSYCGNSYTTLDEVNTCTVSDNCLGKTYGVSWTTMSENIDYSIPYNEWAYYIYRAPTSTDYTFISTSNGDPDIKAFSSKSAAVSDDSAPNWSDTNSGGFSYTTNFADGDVIFLKVQQYNMDYTDTFKVKFATDSETTCPKCGSSNYMDGQCNSCYYGVYNTYCSVCKKYIDDDLSMHMANYHEYVDCAICGTYYPSYDAASSCKVQEGCPGWAGSETDYTCGNCGTIYSSSSDRDKCRKADGCPYYMLCPECGEWTGNYSATLCDRCSGDSENTDPDSGGGSGTEDSCTLCGGTYMPVEYEGSIYCINCYSTSINHNPEYCTHNKYSWNCLNPDGCGASGTYCEGYDDIGEICPYCGYTITKA